MPMPLCIASFAIRQRQEQVDVLEMVNKSRRIITATTIFLCYNLYWNMFWAFDPRLSSAIAQIESIDDAAMIDDSMYIQPFRTRIYFHLTVKVHINLRFSGVSIVN